MPADRSRPIFNNSVCLVTLVESFGFETGSLRIAELRLVSSRRKETRGIDLNNSLGWENDEGIGAFREFAGLDAKALSINKNVLFHLLPK